MRNWYIFAIFTLGAFAVCKCNVETVRNDIIIKNVDRSIDVASQLVKITSKISFENTGKSPAKSVLFSLDAGLKQHVSFIGANGAGGDEGRRLQVTPVNVQDAKGKSFWRIDLRQPLEAGKTTNVEVETVLSHYLSPYPSHVTQNEKQLIMYKGNVYLASPYTVKKQTTTVTVASGTIESYTKFKPATQSEQTITYGPYENTPPHSTQELLVHYENNSPFVTVTTLERAIEVSHWGNIAVEESVDLLHTGAILKGPFSRYEYQRDQNGFASVKSFKTVLPAAAADVYYRDEIGNISTSHLRVLDDAVEVDLRPRFPLFGGWKTHYVIGYNLPSYEYLYNSGDDYVLRMRFVDHIFDDMIVDQATVKIILPEGAKDIEFKGPYNVDRLPNQLHYTYLDTTGRPVVILHKTNLVENHIQEFELHYSYQKILMLQEPLLVVLAFYLLFVLVIIYVRLDFAITKDEVSESKMKVAGHCDQLQAHHDRRVALYQRYDQAIQDFKSKKDNNSFQSTNKKIAADLKAESQAIVEILATLKHESPEIAEKVTELQKHDRLLKEQINQHITNAEKLVAGKMKKDHYIDHEQNINKKKEDILEKMENILTNL